MNSKERDRKLIETHAIVKATADGLRGKKKETPTTERFWKERLTNKHR